MEHGKRSPVTLAGAFVILLLVGLMWAMSVPAHQALSRAAEMRTCASNLSAIGRAWYARSSGLIPKFDETRSGVDWILLHDDPRVLQCPLGPRDPRGTNYRGFDQSGPAGRANECPPDTPMIADRDDNHGLDPSTPMNCVLKSGEVRTFPRGSKYWRVTVPMFVKD